MATSGTLGPTASWDRRLRRLPGSSTLRLDRRSWILHLTTAPVSFEPAGAVTTSTSAELGAALLDACADLRVDFSDWVLPLSGGMDSRAFLLAFLATGRRPHCVTWGLRAASPIPPTTPRSPRCSPPRSGSSTATSRSTTRRRRSAGPHPLPRRRRGTHRGFRRLRRWPRHVEAALRVGGRRRHPRRRAGMGHRTLSLRELRSAPGQTQDPLRLPRVPSHPSTGTGTTVASSGAACEVTSETLTTYRDRIYRRCNLPTSLAALNDVKTTYVEIVNPFLCRRVVKVVRSLARPPSRAPPRTRGLCARVRPRRTLRQQAAPATPTEYLSRGAPDRDQPRARFERRGTCSTDELSTASTPAGHAPAFDRQRGLRQAARKVVPDELARRLRPNAAILLGPRELAFRLYIASRMVGMLERDAAAAERIWRSDTGLAGGR